MKAGNVIAIAASGPAAREVFPDLPEFKEFHPDLNISVWFGIFAPASTPNDVIAMLNSEINKAVMQPDMKKRLGDFGLTATLSSPADLDTLMRQDRARFGPLVKTLGIVAD